MTTAEIKRLIAQTAKKYNIDPALAIALAKAESSFNPDSVSKQGAIGLFQLMPDTAKNLGVDPNDLKQNIDGGIRYLSKLYKQFKSVPLAVAAYNAGPEAVKSAQGIPDNEETQAHVAKVMGTYKELQENVKKKTSEYPGVKPDLIEALDDVKRWAKEQGYGDLTITSTTGGVHQDPRHASGEAADFVLSGLKDNDFRSKKVEDYMKAKGLYVYNEYLLDSKYKTGDHLHVALTPEYAKLKKEPDAGLTDFVSSVMNPKQVTAAKETTTEIPEGRLVSATEEPSVSLFDLSQPLSKTGNTPAGLPSQEAVLRQLNDLLQSEGTGGQPSGTPALSEEESLDSFVKNVMNPNGLSTTVPPTTAPIGSQFAAAPMPNIQAQTALPAKIAAQQQRAQGIINQPNQMFVPELTQHAETGDIAPLLSALVNQFYGGPAINIRDIMKQGISMIPSAGQILSGMSVISTPIEQTKGLIARAGMQFGGVPKEKLPSIYDILTLNKYHDLAQMTETLQRNAKDPKQRFDPATWWEIAQQFAVEISPDALMLLPGMANGMVEALAKAKNPAFAMEKAFTAWGQKMSKGKMTKEQVQTLYDRTVGKVVPIGEKEAQPMSKTMRGIGEEMVARAAEPNPTPSFGRAWTEYVSNVTKMKNPAVQQMYDYMNALTTEGYPLPEKLKSSVKQGIAYLENSGQVEPRVAPLIVGDRVSPQYGWTDDKSYRMINRFAEMLQKIHQGKGAELPKLTPLIPEDVMKGVFGAPAPKMNVPMPKAPERKVILYRPTSTEESAMTYHPQGHNLPVEWVPEEKALVEFQTDNRLPVPWTPTEKGLVEFQTGKKTLQKQPRFFDIPVLSEANRIGKQGILNQMLQALGIKQVPQPPKQGRFIWDPKTFSFKVLP